MRALDLAASVPWAIRQESLQQIFDIAARIHEPDFDTAAARLAERQSEIDFGAVSVSQGKPLQGATSVRMRGSVAVLPVTGPIFRYATLFSAISGATSIEMMARDLRVALNDPDVEAILMHVDSPGGEVNGTGEFADMVYDARGKKPIWAYVSSEGASAAYWIASAAERVICAPTALLGSIGVVAAVPDPSAENKGKVQFVSSQSPYKRPDPNTKSGKSQIQTMIDDLAAEFVNTVARNRDVDAEKVTSDFGQGWILVGQKAVDAGLADAVGSYEQALVEITQDKTPQATKSNAKAASEAVVDATKEGSSSTDDSVGQETARENGPGQKADHSTRKETRHMGLKANLLALLNGASDEELEDEEKTEVTNTTTPPPAPPAQKSVAESAIEIENRQLRDRLAATEQENRRIRAERILENANAFTSELQATQTIVPAEVDGIVAAYVQAATDDSLVPLASGETRVGLLRKAYGARPSHMLTAESLPAALNDLVMLRNNLTTPGKTSDGKPMSEARRKALLGQTDLGRTVLDGTNGTSRN